jgi:3-hydroxybutyryl-CoA dehydrogenase
MTNPQFATVAVLGAGTMGAGIAQVCAQAGSRVVLQDITEEFVQKGLSRIRDFLQKGVEKGKVTEARRNEVLALVSTTVDRAAASRAADLVIEAVPEKLELKNGLFRELAGVVRPDCVLASNTSSLSLAKVFAGVSKPELHRHALLQSGAVDGAARTRAHRRDFGGDDRCGDRLQQAARQGADRGQGQPGVREFAPGRLPRSRSDPHGRSGVASAEDIDKAMVLGYGHPMGPLKLTDGRPRRAPRDCRLPDQGTRSPGLQGAR